MELHAVPIFHHTCVAAVDSLEPSHLSGTSQGDLTPRVMLCDTDSLCDSVPDHIFYKFQPSVVAAACVGAARICLQLSPYWTRDLQRISDYSLEHLSTCIEILLV